jgi:diguanylate cyclase (GGDEF)-like protein/PAS domain S-box-containing protein
VSERESSLNGAKILLIDDNEEIHQLFKHSFERADLKLLSAKDAPSGLKLLSEESIDLVLLDIELPGMNGIECLKQIRSRHLLEALPVFMLTAHADPSYILNALEAGASDYLLKPLGISIMIERIRLHLHYCFAIRSLGRVHDRNKEMLNSSPDLIFRVDSEGRILDLNKTPEGMLIQVFEGVHGSNSEFLLTEAVRSRILEFVKKQEKKGTITVDRIGDLENENFRHVRCFELRMVSCGSNGAVCFVRDITALWKKEKELLELIGTDPLTKVGNRRRFSENLGREWKRQLRDKKCLSLVLIDVDHFKALNDSLGHLEGDKCLINIAAAIESCCLRPGDIAARYGGEEFVVLLPETDATGALIVAERLRKKIEDLKILRRKNDDEHSIVTISAGVATLVPGFSMTSEELIRRADEALYHSKQSGRNLVTDYGQLRLEKKSAV